MDKRVKKAFISIPITGVEEQARSFCRKVKKDLIEKYPEVEFITPFEINSEKGEPDSYYMGKDIAVLIDCDAIISMPNWRLSKGCQVERFTANIYGLRIYSLEDVL